MTYDRIYALRDPFGNRPLCIGTLYNTATAANCGGGAFELPAIREFNTGALWTHHSLNAFREDQDQ